MNVKNIRYRREEPKYYVPFLGGRPVRDLPINSDDIINLKILLETETNFEEFLKKI